VTLKTVLASVPVLFVLLFYTESSWPLDSDFFKRQKKIQKERRLRAQGASSYTKKRNRAKKQKEKQAQTYRKVRVSQKKAQKKQDKAFEAEMLKPEKINTKKMRQAKKYAKKKRRKKSEVDWRTQNLEFGIEVPKVKKK